MPILTSEIMFWKRTLHKYVVYIYAHICICEKLLTKTQSLYSTLPLQAHFLGWRLTRFGKELFIWNPIDHQLPYVDSPQGCSACMEDFSPSILFPESYKTKLQRILARKVSYQGPTNSAQEVPNSIYS